MADRRDSGLKPTRVEKQVNRLDTVAKKLLGTIDTGYNEKTLLGRQDSRVQTILSDELNFSRGVSGGSVIDFVASMAQKTDSRSGSSEMDITDMLTKDVGDIYTYFQDIYKNQFIEITDLKFISRFIPGIAEAVNTTLDSIVSSDDVSTSITRNFVFGPNITEGEQDTVQKELERIEKDEKLLKKLKNIVYRKTLVTGQYYVYHIPYADLFKEYQRRAQSFQTGDSSSIFRNGQIDSGIIRRSREQGGFNLNNPNTQQKIPGGHAVPTIEAYLKSSDPNHYGWKTVDYAAESLVDNMSYLSGEETRAVKRVLGDANIGTFYVGDDLYLTEALESIKDLQTASETYLSPSYASTYGGTNEIPEVDMEVSGNTNSSRRGGRVGKFNVSGTYLKFIDAKNCFPIKVYNQTIGYYYIHSSQSAKRAQKAATGARDTTVSSVGSAVFSSTNLTEKKKDQVINDLADAIADGILNNFSAKFVSKYAEHKKLIADCLIANGLINNDYSIQFIPAEYITPFSINEDEEGRGTSMLINSLFPAKLLLSLTISKLLTYMNKSGNKTIAYVGKGQSDVSTNNHVQRVIRMMQESNITFNDLLSTNLVFSKFTRDSNMQIPRARNGDKLIEFETMEGQNVDLKPEMEDWLEKMAILGTGVPSAIMEFTDSADYAKSLVTANIKHAARVACYQSDLEESTTDLYKALLMGSSLSDELKAKVIPSFEFKLARPRVLSNANVADFIETVQRTAQTMADIWVGPESAAGEEDADKDLPKIRTEFIREYVRSFTPFIDWDNNIDGIYKKAILTVKSKNDYDRSSGTGEAISDEEEEL